MKPCRSIICILVVFMILSMAGSSDSAIFGKKKRISETDLQAEMMAAADRLANYLYNALRTVEQSADAPAVRTLVQRDVVLASVSAFTISADPNPSMALLDLVAMVTMGRLIYENYWLPRYGDDLQPMIQALGKGEREIWRLAAKVIDESEQNTFRDLIMQWHADNLHNTGFAYLRFSYMILEDSVSAADKKKAGGVVKSVQEATRQVEETRLMAERTTYLATRIPLLFGSMGDYWMSELLKNKDIERLLEDVHGVSVTISRLQEIIAQERAAAIDHSMQKINTWSDAAINQTMRSISVERDRAIKQFFKEFNQEREKTFEDLFEKEQAYTRLLAETRATLEEGNQLLVSANELAEVITFKDPNETEVNQAVTIENYQALLTAAKEVLVELNNLVAEAGQTTDPEELETMRQVIISGLGEAEKLGEQLIDLSYKRLILLILFAVVTLFVTQVIFVLIKKKVSQ